MQSTAPVLPRPLASNRATLHGFLLVSGLLIASLVTASCSNRMQPAQRALDTSTAAVNAATPDASRYLPQRWNTLQRRLAGLKMSFDQAQYATVLSDAPAVIRDAQSLARDAAERKDESIKALTSEWAAMVSSVPPLLQNLSERLDQLSKARKPPIAINLAYARATIATAQHQWQQAEMSVSAGNIEDGLASAKLAQSTIASASAAVSAH